MGKKRLQCVAVSDIHLRDVATPAADLLIVSGDITMHGKPKEMRWFADWLSRQPQRNKVWIAGNHEFGIEESPAMAERIAKETKSIYLNDSEVEIEGIRIWGSPITPEFDNGAFNRKRGAEIRRHWNLIPDGLDILITHGPPLQFLDLTRDVRNVGCEELLNVLKFELKTPPRYHIFGHIHAGYGRARLTRDDGCQIEMINASSCNHKYAPVNAPVLFEV